jgi:hypothetical protein
MSLTFILSMIGFAIMWIYIVYIVWKKGELPQSISATIYDLDKKNAWHFSLVMFLTTFLIAPRLMSVVIPNTEILPFATLVGLLGVGAAPLIKGEKNTLHYCSAMLSGCCSQLMLFLNCPWALLLWTPYIIYTLWKEFSGKNMMIAEMVMIMGMMILCIVNQEY